MNITELSSAQLRQAAEEKIEAAQSQLASLLGAGAGNSVPATSATAPAAKKPHWTQRPGAKARLAKAARLGWRKRRQA